MKAVRRCLSTSGIALLELAIVAPVLVFIFVIFWETLVDLTARIRHESAAVQLSNLFRRSPLKITASAVGGETNIDITELDSSALYSETDPLGLLPTFHQAFMNIMANAGTGASHVENNIALSLVYINICTDTTGTCAGKQLGDAEDHHLTVNLDGDEMFMYIPTGADACFGPVGSSIRNSVEERLKEISDERLAMLYSGGTKPLFGKKIIDIATPPMQLGNVLAYIPARAVMFWAMCSIPPRFLNRPPVITYHSFFFPAEVGVG